jgi:hypothetical protein
MSIKTTSGRELGMMRIASSADAQVQTHSKPPKVSMIWTQLRHKSFWSSTKATLIVEEAADLVEGFAKLDFMRNVNSRMCSAVEIQPHDSPTVLAGEETSSRWL